MTETAGDLVGVLGPLGVQLKSLRAGTLDFFSPVRQLIAQAGVESQCTVPVQGSPPNAIAGAGSNVSFTIQPPQVLSDLVMMPNSSGILLELTLTNTGGAPLTIGSYGHFIYSRVLWKYASSLNMTHQSEAALANSFIAYSDEEMATRGPLEGINPATFAPLPIVLAAGASYTYELPLQSVFGAGHISWRNLFSPVECEIQYNGSASFVTAGTPTDLVLSSQQLRFVGYTFANDLRERIVRHFGQNVNISRYIWPQYQTNTIIGSLVAGQPYSVNLGSVPSLCIAVLEWTRAQNSTPLQKGTAIDAPAALTLQEGSQPVSFFAPQTRGAFWRNIFTAPPAVASAALSTLGYNLIPFSAQPGTCITDMINLGSYYISVASQLLLYASTPSASAESACIYYRICNVVQQGSELAIKIL